MCHSYKHTFWRCFHDWTYELLKCVSVIYTLMQRISWVWREAKVANFLSVFMVTALSIFTRRQIGMPHRKWWMLGTWKVAFVSPSSLHVVGDPLHQCILQPEKVFLIFPWDQSSASCLPSISWPLSADTPSENLENDNLERNQIKGSGD